MSKYRIGDTVYGVKSVYHSTKVRCKSCNGEARARFSNGKTVDCFSCTDGERSVSYKFYEAEQEPIKIKGIREFTGIETEYYSDGEWLNSTWLGTLFTNPYLNSVGSPKYSKAYPESCLFNSPREAEAFVVGHNRNAENKALDGYWKSADEDGDDNDY